LIKSKGGKRFGGYRSLAYEKDHDSWSYDPKAFLFSLDRKIQCKLNGKYNQKAICDDDKYIARFGFGPNGTDLWVFINCNTRNDNGCRVGGSYDSSSEYKGDNDKFFTETSRF